MAAYATRSDLAAYVGSSVPLPSNDEQDRKLLRASEHIDYVTLGRIDSDNESHLEAAKMATVAQVEFWLNEGEEVSSAGAVSSYSVGTLDVNFGGAAPGVGGTIPRLAPRARNYLFLAGLLYRGVRS